MNLDDRKVIELSLNDILPNRFQPRIHFSEDAINELAESIKEHGVIQPIVVRKINDKYEIIAGERRYKASVMAGKRTIPAILTDLNDKESAEIALIENVQREDLTPIEEAISYKKILNMGYLTQEDLSTKLGKKQSTISNKLRLLNLDEKVQDALLEKKISERHARSLLKLNSSDQHKMLDRIIKERLTVRKTDSEIEMMINSDINSNQIEILDVDDLPSDKGEMKMNNEINNFNIPTAPIIDDTPMENDQIMSSTPPMNTSIIEEIPAVSSPEIFDIPDITSLPTGNNDINNGIPNQNVIAPGFMDVDKIQNQASDINVEKPVADLSTLLTPTKAPEEIKPVPVDASIFGFAPAEPINNSIKEEEVVKPGKFFDLNNIGEIEEASTPESIGNLLNNAYMQSEKEVPIEQPVIPIDDTKSQMFGINLEPKNPDFVANVESQITNTDFGEPVPIIDNNNFNFDNFFTQTPEEVPNNIPSEPNSFASPSPVITEEISPFINEVPTPVSESVPVVSAPIIESIPVAPTPVAEPVQVPTMVSEPVSSFVSPVVESASVFSTPVVESVPVSPAPTTVNQQAYAVPSVDDLDDFLSNIDSFTPLSETLPELGSVQVPPMVSEPVQAPKIDINKISEIIKDSIAKINALGIKVDLDEFDFDDMYQAIIKVDK